MAQDLFQLAKEKIDDAKESSRDQHERIRADLRFSNPANPEQWGEADLALRKGRASLTLDRTNQFISQVVNDARQNNPGVEIIGVDESSDPKVAETLGGIARHIEYRSHARQAYDMGIELSARCGQGWLRWVPEVVDEATNEQEVKILRVVDPLSCGLDPNSQDAVGADAMWGYAETRWHDRTFKATYPKAKPVPFGEATWYQDGFITVCEYFELQETTENRIIAVTPDGMRNTFTEDEYWRKAQEIGTQPLALGTIKGKKRTQKWVKMSGAEVLEETAFPSQFLPIVPVLGYEIWVDGKRYVCGLTRRLMDGQKLHNYQMSAMAEFMASQPKAPFLMPFEAIEGYEGDWKKLSQGNPSYLPYNHMGSDGQLLPAPQRLAPPTMPGAYANMAQFAVQEMEASVGMYKANLGQQGNETSGRAIRARQMEGDTSTFHFVDNLGRGVEQLWRGIIDAVPVIYDTARIKQIIGVDGQTGRVKINPEMSGAAKLDPKGKVTEINPNVGKYDVRIKVGPAYTTQREETAQQLADMIQAQPQLAPILGPMWARMKDMPESERISRLLLAMAPPQVQALESDEDEIPPQAQAKIQALEQQAQEMHQLIDAATAKIQELQGQDKELTMKYLVEAAKLENDEARVLNDRLKILQPQINEEGIAALVTKLVREMLTAEPLTDGEQIENLIQGQMGIADEVHPPIELPPPQTAEETESLQEQLPAPSGASFSPEAEQ